MFDLKETVVLAMTTILIVQGSELTTQCKSRGQDSIYENSCKVSVAEGHVAQRLYDYGPEFYVAFKVRVLEHPSAHWNSILAITNSDNWGRFPAVWFQKNRFFHITTTDTASYDFHGVKLNHEYNIVISQQYNMKNELIHRITINDQEVRSIVNSKPKTISQALVYLSGPYPQDGSFNDTGEVSAVTVIPGHVYIDPKPTLIKGNEVGHFENFGEEFTVDFKFKLTKDFPMKKMSVLRLGKSQNEVMPSIRMTKNQHLSICASINGDKNWKHCYQHPIDNINQEYHVVVTQGFFVREKLMFMVLIDNEMVYARDNPKPLIFNGTLHLTSPWIHSLGTFGALTDLKVYMRPYPTDST